MRIFTYYRQIIYIFKFSIVIQLHHYFLDLWKEWGKRFCWWWCRCWWFFLSVLNSFWRRIACLSDVFRWADCPLPAIFGIVAIVTNTVWWCSTNRLRAIWFLFRLNFTFLEMFFEFLCFFFLYLRLITFWMSWDLYYYILDLAWVRSERRSAIFLSLS